MKAYISIQILSATVCYLGIYSKSLSQINQVSKAMIWLQNQSKTLIE